LSWLIWCLGKQLQYQYQLEVDFLMQLGESDFDKEVLHSGQPIRFDRLPSCSSKLARFLDLTMLVQYLLHISNLSSLSIFLLT